MFEGYTKRPRRGKLDQEGQTYPFENPESREVDPVGHNVVGQLDEGVLVTPKVLVDGEVHERLGAKVVGDARHRHVDKH